MADNVIPFPVQRRQATSTAPGETAHESQPVTREEMIQLVLRYAYGTRWAEEPTPAGKSADRAGDD